MTLPPAVREACERLAAHEKAAEISSACPGSPYHDGVSVDWERRDGDMAHVAGYFLRAEGFLGDEKDG